MLHVKQAKSPMMTSHGIVVFEYHIHNNVQLFVCYTEPHENITGTQQH